MTFENYKYKHMKKFTFIICILLITSLHIDAQRRTQTIKWFSIAAKGGYGNSILLNIDNITDRNVVFNFFTPSYTFGGRLTFSYGERIGFGADVLYASFGQKYTVNNNNDVYEKNLDIKALDIFPFFRLSGTRGGYLEIGPKFTSVKSLTMKNSIENPMFLPTDKIAENYSLKFTSLVFGFGVALYKNDRLDINIGPRFAYSFSNFTPGHNYNVVNDGYYMPENKIVTPTNPLSVQGILEINYFFAFWGDATCGKGRLMFFK